MAQIGGTLTFFQKQKLLKEKASQAQKSSPATESPRSVEGAVMTDASVSDSHISGIQNLPARRATMSPDAPSYTPSSQVETSAPTPATPVVKKAPHHVFSGPASVPSGTRRMAPGPHSALHSGPPPTMHSLKDEESTSKRLAGPHAQPIPTVRRSEVTARTEPAVPPTAPVATEHAHPVQQMGDDQPMTEHAHPPQQADDDQSMAENVDVLEDESAQFGSDSVFTAQHAHAAERTPSAELTLLAEEIATTQATEANGSNETNSTNGTASSDIASQAVVLHQSNGTTGPVSDWLSLFLSLEHLPEARPAILAYLKALQARIIHLDKADEGPSLADKRFPFLLKLSTGQQLPANVLGSTTVAEVIKQVVDMTLVGEEQCTVSVTTSPK